MRCEGLVRVKARVVVGESESVCVEATRDVLAVRLSPSSDYPPR